MTREIGPDTIEHHDPAPVAPAEIKRARRRSGLERRIAFLLRAPQRALMMLRRLRTAPALEDRGPVRLANDAVWSLGALDAYVVALGGGTAARLTRDPVVERHLWGRFLRAWVRVRPNADLRAMERRGERPWQPYWDEMFAADEQEPAP